MAEKQGVVPAHDQTVSHRYVIHYPEHPPRTGDPHYVDFNEYHRRTRATARCAFAVRTGDYSECADALGHPAPAPESGEQPGLELHHAHVEFSLQNGIDLTRLEHIYPGISDPEHVGAWVETAANLVWYCARHHRGHGGVHVAASSDFEASHFVRDLIS